jgi:hypothetical protein
MARSPEVTVNPLDAVSNPALVIVPDPVVEILPVVEIVMLAARSPPTTDEKVGSPDALPCSTVVVVPARVPSNPPEVLVTTPAVVNPASVTEVLPVRVVKVPLPGVPDPIDPGAAKVAPFKDEAFRLATLVVEATTKGAVPVATVEVNCPDILMVDTPDRAPELMINPLIVLVEVGPLMAPALVIVPDPVVEILPEVDSVPSSLIVNLDTPPDRTSIAVLVPALVSSVIKEAAVPCWVRVKD